MAKDKTSTFCTLVDTRRHLSSWPTSIGTTTHYTHITLGIIKSTTSMANSSYRIRALVDITKYATLASISKVQRVESGSQIVGRIVCEKEFRGHIMGTVVHLRQQHRQPQAQPHEQVGNGQSFPWYVPKTFFHEMSPQVLWTTLYSCIIVAGSSGQHTKYSRLRLWYQMMSQPLMLTTLTTPTHAFAKYIYYFYTP